ncbi:hypothetical protein Tco_1202846 [Tanacetum coccineum]
MVQASPLKMQIRSSLGLYLLPGLKSKGNQNSRRRDAWNTGNKDKDNRRRSAVQAQTQRTNDIEDSPMNDRYAEGMHAVPPLMIGIYIPSRPDKEIDDSQYIT